MRELIGRGHNIRSHRNYTSDLGQARDKTAQAAATEVEDARLSIDWQWPGCLFSILPARVTRRRCFVHPCVYSSSLRIHAASSTRLRYSIYYYYYFFFLTSGLFLSFLCLSSRACWWASDQRPAMERELLTSASMISRYFIVPGIRSHQYLFLRSNEIQINPDATSTHRRSVKTMSNTSLTVDPVLCRY